MSKVKTLKFLVSSLPKFHRNFTKFSPPSAPSITEISQDPQNWTLTPKLPRSDPIPNRPAHSQISSLPLHHHLSVEIQIECLNLSTWFEIKGAPWWSCQSLGICWSSTLTRGTIGGPLVIPPRCTRPRYGSSYHRYMREFTRSCLNVFQVWFLYSTFAVFFSQFLLPGESVFLVQSLLKFKPKLVFLWLHVLIHE